mgnify:CR=1 FL=1
MNIEKIKNDLEQNKGKLLNFKFNGSRNQTEVFKGTIENTYNYVFLIRVDDDNAKIRSFSYTDILTESLEIFVDK